MEASPSGAGLRFENRRLDYLPCQGQLRLPKPGEPLQYTTCRHDYTRCANIRCVKKLV